MSGGKTTGQALGGVAMILLNLALQISGYQSPLVAVVLAVIAFCLLLPWLNEQRKVAASAGKRLRDAYRGSNHVRSMVFVILIGAAIGALIGGGLAGLWWMRRASNIQRETPQQSPMPSHPPSSPEPSASAKVVKSSDEMPAVMQTPTPTPRRINTFTPREIHNEMARTGPLELKEVGESFVNGVVDWTLVFSSVHGSRGDPEIQVNFGPEDGFPPTIACTRLPLKGNEYLGRIKPPARFRVRGVIGSVQENIIVLTDVTVEQLPIPPTPTPPMPAPSTPSVTPTQTPPKSALSGVEREVGPKNVPPKKEPEVLADANEVFGIFNGRTALNVIELLKPHAGKVIEVTGKLYNLSPNLTAIVQIEVGPVIICNFNAEWTEKLRALNPGDAMRVRGKIAPGQGGHGLDLRMCELLSSTPP